MLQYHLSSPTWTKVLWREEHCCHPLRGKKRQLSQGMQLNAFESHHSIYLIDFSNYGLCLLFNDVDDFINSFSRCSILMEIRVLIEDTWRALGR